MNDHERKLKAAAEKHRAAAPTQPALAQPGTSSQHRFGQRRVLPLIFAAALLLVAAVGASIVITNNHNSPASAPTAATTTSPVQMATTRTKPSTPPTPEQICQGAFSAADLLDWAPGTVDDFRTYHYGGPKPTISLAHAFPGLPATTRGAWCGTKAGTHTTHWSALLVGQKAISVITITGPGEGDKRGSVPRPPQVP